MLVILGVMIYAGEYFFPERSTPEDLVAFRNLYDVFNLEEKYGAPAKWIAWWFITMVSMNSITWAMFYYFMKADPENTSMKHFWDQAKVILINFAQLPLLQIVWDMLEQNGYTKATMGNLDPISIVRDCLLWMLCFEWAWYF
jgi:hypothetical protein